MIIGISIPTTRTLEQEYHANKMKLFLQLAKKKPARNLPKKRPKEKGETKEHEETCSSRELLQKRVPFIDALNVAMKMSLTASLTVKLN